MKGYKNGRGFSSRVLLFVKGFFTSRWRILTVCSCRTSFYFFYSFLCHPVYFHILTTHEIFSFLGGVKYLQEQFNNLSFLDYICSLTSSLLFLTLKAKWCIVNSKISSLRFQPPLTMVMSIDITKEARIKSWSFTLAEQFVIIWLK